MMGARLRCGIAEAVLNQVDKKSCMNAGKVIEHQKYAAIEAPNHRDAPTRARRRIRRRNFPNEAYLACRETSRE